MRVVIGRGAQLFFPACDLGSYPKEVHLTAGEQGAAGRSIWVFEYTMRDDELPCVRVEGVLTQLGSFANSTSINSAHHRGVDSRHFNQQTVGKTVRAYGNRVGLGGNLVGKTREGSHEYTTDIKLLL